MSTTNKDIRNESMQYKVNRMLVSAAQKNDTKGVIAALKAGAQIEFKDYLAIYWAKRKNAVEVLDILERVKLYE